MQDHNRGVGPITGNASDRIRVVIAQIDVAKSDLVAPNDILYEIATGRIFIVIAIARHPGLLRLQAAEVRAPIPDEFESGIIDQFWTQYRAWEIDPATGEAISSASTTTGYQKSNLADTPFLYQLVSGDFDVYTQVFVGSVAAQTRAAFIKAGLPNDSAFIGVGITSDVNQRVFLRYENNGVAAQSTHRDGWPIGLYVWLRLQRVGVRFSAFYSALQDAQRPVKSSDWTEITETTAGAPGAGFWTSSADLRLGLAFYNGNAAAVDFKAKFFRNWQADMR